MKDKQAAKAKQKRQQKRNREREKERESIMAEIDKAAKARGLVKYDANKMYSEFRQLDAQSTMTAVARSVLIVSYCLHRHCGWGRSRLGAYAQSAHHYIYAVDNRERSILQLREELELEAGLKFDIFKPMSAAKSEEKALAEKIAYVIPLALYALYSRWGWRKKRMTRLCGFTAAALDGKTADEMRTVLRSECGLHYMDSGEIYAERRKNEQR